MATDQQILDGEIVNAPKGRFSTPRVRCKALLLNERGWHACKNDHWHDLEPGDPCFECGEPMRKERAPDKGSVFEQVYRRWLESNPAWQGYPLTDQGARA